VSDFARPSFRTPAVDICRTCVWATDHPHAHFLRCKNAKMSRHASSFGGRMGLSDIYNWSVLYRGRCFFVENKEPAAIEWGGKRRPHEGCKLSFFPAWSSGSAVLSRWASAAGRGESWVLSMGHKSRLAVDWPTCFGAVLAAITRAVHPSRCGWRRLGLEPADAAEATLVRLTYGDHTTLGCERSKPGTLIRVCTCPERPNPIVWSVRAGPGQLVLVGFRSIRGNAGRSRCWFFSGMPHASDGWPLRLERPSNHAHDKASVS